MNGASGASPAKNVRQRRPGMNLAPLVDVVFLLLIFFMVATSFLSYETAPLRLAAAGEAGRSDTTVTVTVGGDGGLVYDGHRLTVAALADSLRRERRKRRLRGGLKVVIAAGRGAKVQHMVDALDAARAAGVSDIAFGRGVPAPLPP